MALALLRSTFYCLLSNPFTHYVHKKTVPTDLSTFAPLFWSVFLCVQMVQMLFPILSGIQVSAYTAMWRSFLVCHRQNRGQGFAPVRVSVPKGRSSPYSLTCHFNRWHDKTQAFILFFSNLSKTFEIYTQFILLTKQKSTWKLLPHPFSES